MTIIVTGGSGFIGSHLVDELLSRKLAVRALMHNKHHEFTGHAAATDDRKTQLQLAVGDMVDGEFVRRALEGAAVVYHCAAADDKNSARNACAANLAGLRNILETLRETKSRLVLMSGLSVLGLVNRDPLTEDAGYQSCLDPEIVGKQKAETMAWDYRKRHGLEVCVLRAGFVYGSGDRRNLLQLVDAIRRRSFVYIGSRHNVVPLVHVRDMVRALALAGSSPRSDGRTYHIADGSRTTQLDLTQLICEVTELRRPRWTIPYYPTLAVCAACERLEHFCGWPAQGPISRATLLFLGTSRYVDIRRAKEELNFVPRISIREGLPEAVRSFKEVETS
jgi:nucleoside-diphosphate-sugar epimerase